MTIDALTGAGTITSGTTTTNNMTLTVGVNNGSGTFSGVFEFTGAYPNSLYGLTKVGSGVQVLSGSNMYNGITTVNQGTLKLDFSAAARWATT